MLLNAVNIFCKSQMQIFLRKYKIETTGKYVSQIHVRRSFG